MTAAKNLCSANLSSSFFLRTILHCLWIILAAACCLQTSRLTIMPLQWDCNINIAFFFLRNAFRNIIDLHQAWMVDTEEANFLVSAKYFRL